MIDNFKEPRGADRATGTQRRGARLVSLYGALIALGLLTPARGTAACMAKSLDLPVTISGTRALATVRINGTEVRLMVDSGAFHSFLTRAAAEQLHLPPSRALRDVEVLGLTGKVDARTTRVERLQFLNGDIPNVEFMVGGNEPGEVAMGVLWRNLLAFADTEYDIAHGMIRFMFPNDDCEGKNMAYWAGDAPVSELALRPDPTSMQPAIFATAQLNGKDIKVEFDSGAMSTVWLDTARRAGVAEADMKPDGTVQGAGHGEAKSWIAPIRKFELGGEVVANSRLRIADFKPDDDEVDMLLGIDFFLSHRIYVSKRQHRLFFTYNGGPVFEQNGVAAVQADASDALAQEGAMQSTDDTGYARRAAVLVAQHDFVHALANLDRACEMAPQSADHFTRRGLVHGALKQVPEALRDFDTALRLDPAHSEARLQRATLREASDDDDGAIDDLKTLDRTLAPQAHERLEMARLYMRLYLPDQALLQWNRWIPAHRNEGDLDSVLNERCWARAMLGVELDKALDDCDESVFQQPGNADFRESRAWVYLRRGELRDALSDFDRALKLQPDGAWSLYGRGIARIRQGDAVNGRADLEAARKALPSIDASAGRYGLAANPGAAAPAAP